MSCHIQSHLPHRKRKYIAQAEVAYSQQKHVLSAGADALDITQTLFCKSAEALANTQTRFCKGAEAQEYNQPLNIKTTEHL